MRKLLFLGCALALGGCVTTPTAANVRAMMPGYSQAVSASADKVSACVLDKLIVAGATVTQSRDGETIHLTPYQNATFLGAPIPMVRWEAAFSPQATGTLVELRSIPLGGHQQYPVDMPEIIAACSKA